MKKTDFNIKEILKFLVGGGSAVLTDFTVYHILLYAGAELSFSKAVSYVAGAAVGFIINKLWTFESKRFSIAEILKFVALYAFSAVVNTLVNYGVLEIIGINLLAFLCATGTSTIINFLGQKFFVFRKKLSDSNL